MSLKPLLRKLLLIDLIKGLKVTFNYQAPVRQSRSSTHWRDLSSLSATGACRG